MQILKKVTLFFLIQVLLLGMLPSMGAADYSDSETMIHKEAIQLLDSLNIMKGYEDGSFKPQGFLTRTQAAKMIYVAHTGVDDQAALFAKLGTNSFVDVPAGFWGLGYINYSVHYGFVSGRGNDRFDPNGLITGYEFMKILLGALGYHAETERFSNNPNWKYYVVAAAVDAGLTEGYDGNANLFITREQAAKMTANMIFARTVGYQGGSLVMSNVTFGQKHLNLVVNTGVVTANEATDAALKGKTTLEVPSNGTGSSGTYHVSTGLDDLGHSVTIYTKGNSFSAIYGSANLSPANRAVTTFSKLTVGSAAVQGSLNRWLSEHALSIGPEQPVFLSKGLGEASNAPIANNAAGMRLTAVDNDGDKKVDYLIQIQKLAATVTSKSNAGSGSIVFDTIPGTWTAGNVDNFDTLVVGDVVLAYEFGGMLRVRKAEFFTGSMTSSMPKQEKATINGNVYAGSEISFADIDGTDSAAETFGQWIVDFHNFDQERIFYLDEGNHIIRIRTPDVEPVIHSYAYVLDSGWIPGNWPFQEQKAVVKLLNEDGTIGIANVNKLGDALIQNLSTEALGRYFDKATAHEELVLGKVFSYHLNSDGTVDLQLAEKQESAPTVIAASEPNLVGNRIFADNQTKVIHYNPETGATKTYTGVTKIPGYSNVSGMIVSEGILAKAIFITSAVDDPIDPKLVYITGEPTISMDSNRKYVYTYPVFENGREGTIAVGEPNSNLEKGLYTYTISDWGDYTFVRAGDVSGQIAYAGDGIVVVESTAYLVQQGTQVYQQEANGTFRKGTSAVLERGKNLLIVLSDNAKTADIIYILS